MEIPRKTKIPKRGAPKTEIIGFRDQFFDEFSVSRSRDLERFARNLYYYLGRQWIETDTKTLVDGVRGWFWRDMGAPKGVSFPKPVANYVSGAVDGEVVSHWTRELVPTIVTTSRDPSIQEAALYAKRVLLDRNKKTNWKRVKYRADFETALMGIGIIKTYWDSSWVDLTLVGVTTARICPMCGTKLSTPEIPESAVDSIHPTLLDRLAPSETGEAGENPQFAINHCPMCGVVSELKEYEVLPEEARNQKDFYGRPLGRHVPKGNTALENVSPFDFFPENGGIGVTTYDCRQFGQATVRSIDWVLERLPELANTIKPDDQHELMSMHPTLGDYSILGYYDRQWDSETFSNHVKVYEFYSLPTIWDPRGRTFWVINDEVALDEDLLVTVTDGDKEISVPRVQYSFSTYRLKPGHFFPGALPDDIISPQNRLNCIDAQIVRARQRLGDPNIAVRKGTVIDGPSTLPGSGGQRIIEVTPSPEDPNAPNLGIQFFGDKLFDTNVYQERDRCVTDIKNLGYLQDVQRGVNPVGQPTSSGAQMLLQQADLQRNLRDMEINERDNRVHSHTLELLWVLRVEDDTIEVEEGDGTWRQEQFNRTHIKAQTQVRMEAEGYVGESLYFKEKVRECIADGLIIVSDNSARERILKRLNMPTDINDMSSREVDLARRQWVEWVQNGTIPTIDPTLDDPATRWQELGIQFKSDDGIRLAKIARWPEIAQVLWGWEDRLRQLEAENERVLSVYGGPVPADRVDSAWAAAKVRHQASMSAYQMQKEQFEAADPIGPDGMPMAQPFPNPPPQEPPQPLFLPESIVERIKLVWKQMLKESSLPLQLANKESMSYMEARAVLEGYRLLSERAAAAAAMPPPAVPGKGATRGVPEDVGVPAEGPNAMVG